MDNVDQRLQGFFQRRIGVVAMRVKQVNIVQTHALQTLVEACHQVLS